MSFVLDVYVVGLPSPLYALKPRVTPASLKVCDNNDRHCQYKAVLGQLPSVVAASHPSGSPCLP